MNNKRLKQQDVNDTGRFPRTMYEAYGVRDELSEPDTVDYSKLNALEARYMPVFVAFVVIVVAVLLTTGVLK